MQAGVRGPPIHGPESSNKSRIPYSLDPIGVCGLLGFRIRSISSSFNTLTRRVGSLGTNGEPNGFSNPS